ncbi:hypothetical protein N7G274_004089 [Stereocaulon virgatum]|uniref:Gfo/Idh/MocA-like oxidoreductase N-terminal domain-containing protein n=1 Tax=Stereocaulon virgatum TaxID=373712 RepID=A0ABR4ABZ8_9LECA
MCGTTGASFPAIRGSCCEGYPFECHDDQFMIYLPSGERLQNNISSVYDNLDVSFDSFPSDRTSRDPQPYKAAIDTLFPGDGITIFTSDTIHYPIALYASQHAIHVLITKPAVKHFFEHQELIRESRKYNVFVFIEHHKLFDLAYADAKATAKTLGDFSYFYSYVSQPKSHLETFKAWAGKDSDISYYLNSHHVDVCESMVPDHKPMKVTASGSRGIAEDLGSMAGIEDTISLLVEWQKRLDPARKAAGVYTASWIAPQRAGVHSNQYFHCQYTQPLVSHCSPAKPGYLHAEMASKGEIRIDQARRGYDVAEDSQGQLMWYNPFEYALDEKGNFNVQTGYGYIKFEKFVNAVAALKAGNVTLHGLEERGLPTLKNTIATTAILEAGRRSLGQCRSVGILDDADGTWGLQ